MKIKISILFTIIGLVASCTKYLDVKPKGKDVISTIDHINGLFNNLEYVNFYYYSKAADGAYSSVWGALPLIYMTDESIATSETVNNLNMTALAAFKWDPNIYTPEQNSPEWEMLYRHIYNYNLIIKHVMNVEGGTDQQKKEYLAEARVNRAFLHLTLVNFFAKQYNKATASSDLGVPIVKEPNSNEVIFTRNSVQEVYDFIISELEESCPELNAITKHRRRVYQTAGYMFLGKAYWFMGNYEKALAAFEIAKDATAQTDIPLDVFDYNTTFSKWGYNPAGKNYAWYSGIPSEGALDYSETVFLKGLALDDIGVYYTNPRIFVKPEFYNLYTASDLRTKFFSDSSYLGTTTWPYQKRKNKLSMNMAASMPELYLLLAECKARTNDLAGAKNDLEYLRARRMSGEDAIVNITNKDDLIRFVIEERKREFMLTGMRWFDMRRLWNDPLFVADRALATHTDGTNVWKLTEDRLTMQIPPNIMFFNPGWQQNP